MRIKAAAIVAIIILLLAASAMMFFPAKERPVVAWYVVVKHLGDDFLEKAEQYRPDIILLTVYAEDDILPLNGSDFDIKGMVDSLHALGIEVYYSFSLFSRSAVPREEYERLMEEGIPYSEQNIHMADYSRELKENNPEKYLELFGPYLEAGLDPEEIPHVERKPVDGYYIPPGHYTSIDPMYQPYHEFMAKMIQKMIDIAKPDGLVFDHGRFFTFDDGYNKDIRDWILNESGFDIYNYTPRPIFEIGENWTAEDRTYYDMRAQVIKHAVSDIVSRFPGYPKFATTIGMIEPARVNGQYVELQIQVFDALLLMEYGEDEKIVRENVRKTAEKIGSSRVILGIFPFGNPETAIRNIDIGMENSVKGIYLLGYDFPDSVHDYLLKIRGLSE